MKLLEVCVDTFAAAEIAAACGADRLELCTDLSVGGLTPDPGLLERVVTGLVVPVQVMIRPRSGGFIYTGDEIETMVTSIRYIGKYWPGIRGFVTGVLLPDGSLHVEAMKRLQEAAGAYPLTLHRAFDRTRNLEESLETCIELGIERILTSGGADSVDGGMDMLRKLQHSARGRISILPGGGVRPDNARQILDIAGVMELHLSGRKAVAIGPAPDDRAFEADGAALLEVRKILNQ